MEKLKKIRKISKKTFTSLGVYNFRLYFFAQAISLSGTWMQVIGQSWIVLELTGSGTAVGIVTALQFLPMLLFGAYGGVIADRFNKRTVLYVTQSVSCLLAVILGALVITHTVELWMIKVLALLLGLVSAVDSPTRQTFISEMVGRDHLTNAISVNSIQVNLARVIGPAIAGVIIAAFGLGVCFIVNAVSFIPVIIALALMRKNELHAAERITVIRGKLMEGFRYVRDTPVLRDTLVMLAIVGTLAYEFSVVVPLFAQFTLGGTARTYATLNVAIGLGSLAGGLYTSHRKVITRRMIYGSAIMFGLSMATAAVTSTLTPAFISMTIMGFYSICFLSQSNSVLQIESTPSMRGRVMALWAVAYLGSTPIGGPIIGWASQAYSPRLGLLLGAGACLVAGIYGYIKHKKTDMPVAVPSIS